MEEKGKSFAVASMVLGIVALLFTFLIQALVGMILGIVGLVLAVKAKNLGFQGGMRTAGFVMNLICVIVGALLFVIALIAIIGLSAMM